MGHRENGMKTGDELTVIEKTMVLSKWELFGGLPTDEVALIAANTHETQIEAGDLDPGAPEARCIHFVLGGELEIHRDGRMVRRAREGQVAGSLGALFEDEPHETLRATRPTRSLALAAEDLERAVRDHPDFAMALIRGLVRIVRERSPD